MKTREITISDLLNMAENGISTFSVKDNSPRGCKTVPASMVKVGDKVVIDNYFNLVVDDPAEEIPEAVAMVAVDELESGLNLGDYGEYLNDYRDSSSYICDAITEIADNNTSIYHSDIMAFLSRNPEAVEDAIDEFGWDGCGGTLERASQMGEFLTIERDLYDHMADAVMLAAVHFIRYDLKIEEIPEELADLIRQWADEANNNDRMDEIPDKIREYLSPEEDGDE